MIGARASFYVLLTTSIVGLPGGALAAGKIRLAQSSAVTTCMMMCNSTFANCQSACVTGTFAVTQGLGNTTAIGNARGDPICLSNCTTQQLTCSQGCALQSPSN